MAVAAAAIVAAAACVTALGTAPSAAQSRPGYDTGRPEQPTHATRRGPSEAALGSIGDRVNANTVTIVSGNINGTYLTIAYDLSAVLDDGDSFRVLPVIGKGGGQNIRDVRFLRGVDLGITQSNLLRYFQRTNEVGRIDDKLAYVARLFNEEMHLVVRADSGVHTIADLAGQKVNFSDAGSGTQLTTRDVFTRLEIAPVEVNMGQADAFEKLQSGEIAATVLIAGKPAAAMRKLGATFRMLPIAFARPLQGDYLPARLTSEDYPGVIPPGEAVDTIAVGTVLFAYNWPRNTDRYRRIAAFVDRFFPRLAEFQKPPRHPKWRETNLNATVPGWIRFPAAQEWLERNVAADTTREQFERFLAARGPVAGDIDSPAERERLFQNFLQWNQSRERR
ncbi:TAXI family TRAP transporter solute-binding subunit [Rhodoplanes sp. TEM]|uniref:TAXI family TRAP transporter solute-binding subunit n=1 Tax=Rhodoplanes tepidamans TaxID=200616 RepID=A0ABT5JF17_RHOTP|nr:MULTISPECIES: TAXI family TRAP transporter solute-binding subunit [Rhodoplanes]MDC7788278.1 TAXI family TRAP transporter solute-binding subunit [Rhodoplanes tepidamans]MDC7987090.1 TAXI family TRAP transporter solute-binding subunit [Rhodoplanes sp. TEM]MDQ0355669.1 TRAP transporter TAXI family solute receptor [Rhodoplanes tepidamans]